MDLVKMKKLACPGCGSCNDAASSVNAKSAEPKPGQYGVCLHCGIVTEITPDFQLREVAPEEVLTWDPRNQAIIHRAGAQAAALRKQYPDLDSTHKLKERDAANG